MWIEEEKDIEKALRASKERLRRSETKVIRTSLFWGLLLTLLGWGLWYKPDRISTWVSGYGVGIGQALLIHAFGVWYGREEKL